MYLSTVIPSTMLNSTANNGMNPYRFSIPYDFSKGKDINININPRYSALNTEGSMDLLVQSTIQKPNEINSFRFTIPTGTTIYSKDIVVTHIYGNQNDYGNILKYTVNITCDSTKNTITFTPISVINPVPNVLDANYTAPVLMTIFTIL